MFNRFPLDSSPFSTPFQTYSINMKLHPAIFHKFMTSPQYHPRFPKKYPLANTSIWKNHGKPSSRRSCVRTGFSVAFPWLFHGFSSHKSSLWSSEQFWKHFVWFVWTLNTPKISKSWCWIDQAFPHQKWGFIRSSRHFQTQKSSISPGEVAIFLHFGPEIHTDTTSSGDQRYRRFVSFRQGCWIYLYSICGAVPLPSQPPVSWELVDDPQGTSIYKYRHDQIFETINHQMTSKSVNYNIYIYNNNNLILSLILI